MISYLADQHPGSGLVPAPGTIERLRIDQLLTFAATEIAQKHIPLMRKLMTAEGTEWTRDKIVAAYAVLDQRLADGRPWLNGDAFKWSREAWQAPLQERSNLRSKGLLCLYGYGPPVQRALRRDRPPGTNRIQVGQS